MQILLICLLDIYACNGAVIQRLHSPWFREQYFYNTMSWTLKNIFIWRKSLKTGIISTHVFQNQVFTYSTSSEHVISCTENTSQKITPLARSFRDSLQCVKNVSTEKFCQKKLKYQNQNFSQPPTSFHETFGQRSFSCMTEVLDEEKAK